MRRRKSSQYRISLDQCRNRNNHFFAPRETAVNFVCGEFVMLMPRAYRRNHTACIGKESGRHF